MEIMRSYWGVILVNVMVSVKRCNNIEFNNDNFLCLYDSLNFFNIEM